MVAGARRHLPHRIEYLRVGFGGQNGSRTHRHSLYDPRHLIRRLPFAQNDLSEAPPEQAMMIQLGKADILVGHELQLVQCLVHVNVARLHFIQQLAQLISIHESTPSFRLPVR